MLGHLKGRPHATAAFCSASCCEAVMVGKSSETISKYCLHCFSEMPFSAPYHLVIPDSVCAPVNVIGTTSWAVLAAERSAVYPSWDQWLCVLHRGPVWTGTTSLRLQGSAREVCCGGGVLGLSGVGRCVVL